jgi:hypothetical protein
LLDLAELRKLGVFFDKKWNTGIYRLNFPHLATYVKTVETKLNLLAYRMADSLEDHTGYRDLRRWKVISALCVAMQYLYDCLLGGTVQYDYGLKYWIYESDRYLKSMGCGLTYQLLSTRFEKYVDLDYTFIRTVMMPASHEDSKCGITINCRHEDAVHEMAELMLNSRSLDN